MEKEENRKVNHVIFRSRVKHILSAGVSLLSLGLTGLLLAAVLLGGKTGTSSGPDQKNKNLMNSFDMYMTNRLSDALEGVLDVEKVYWLHDEDVVAPEPDPAKFGTASDPASLQWLLDEARDLLGVEGTIFSTDVQLLPGSEITYYLDETIFCITWKTPIGTANYTFSEVKIAHPSQFRRFLADGTYGSERQYYTTDMAASVNAVTASNGDFYKFRPFGIVVYNGKVCRVDSRVDTCFVDDQGQLIFVRAGQITDWDAAQRFVDEHNIRFSMAFGPVLIEDGKNVVPYDYILGEINGNFSRAAICQVEQLHYLLAVTGYEEQYRFMPTTGDFGDVLVKMGVKRAYCLDGGQTAAIVTGDKLINRPNYGVQRTVSDIIYFATAVPDGG